MRINEGIRKLLSADGDDVWASVCVDGSSQNGGRFGLWMGWHGQPVDADGQ